MNKFSPQADGSHDIRLEAIAYWPDKREGAIRPNKRLSFSTGTQEYFRFQAAPAIFRSILAASALFFKAFGGTLSVPKIKAEILRCHLALGVKNIVSKPPPSRAMALN